MKDRKGNQAAGKAKLAVFGKEERCGLREYLQSQAQLLQPMPRYCSWFSFAL